MIPIHAYPVMSTSDFPDHIDFPSVPVGHNQTKVIPLRCHAPIDFEYQLSVLQPHPAFSVGPMEGQIISFLNEYWISFTLYLCMFKYFSFTSYYPW